MNAITPPAPAPGADYVPGRIVVGLRRGAHASFATDAEQRMGVRLPARPLAAAAADVPQVVKLPRGLTVGQAGALLRHQPGVAYAVPDYIAHTDGMWDPDDPGDSGHAGGWEALQWNFLPSVGVNAPEAWSNLIADHHPGGKGVLIAVLDTGIAYRNWHHFRRSPDFDHTHFTDPWDFVSGNAFPLDRVGHGTFVAGTIAESTNNGRALTGLAYGATIMPVRVLDSRGMGDASVIARGIRYAVKHHAQVINLSLEFTPDVTAADIPDIMGALRFAARHHVTVVAAAGNDGVSQVAYPARAPTVISVGATTRDRCLAEYSNIGNGLNLVAPGGGEDTSLLSDPNCHPGRPLPPIYQMTFRGSNPRKFGLPSGIYGTSMSTPHVAAAAALVIASGVIGHHPTPAQIRQRLEQTAQPLGDARPNPDYGWGLLDAGAATARSH